MAADLLLVLALQSQLLFVIAQNPYSLQSAVEALRRRESQLALREYENGQIDEYDKNYEQESELNKQRDLNLLLAQYFDREANRENSPHYYNVVPTDDQNEYYENERRQPIFRENEELPYHSVFRELDDKNTNKDLEFLNEIDRQQQLERENDYKNQIKQLWNVYGRQQNNKIANDLLLSNNNVHRQILEKRQLILPWLPASRRKRFRVVKRSPINNVKKFINVSGTNETVTKELRSLFGPSSILDERRKRSNNGQKQSSSPPTPPPGEILNGANSHQIIENESQHNKNDCKTDHDHSEDHKNHQHHETNGSHENAEELINNNQQQSSINNEKNYSKLKRSYRNDLIPFRKKKAIEWSKYLGLDRRKKSDSWDNKKPKEYPLNFYRNQQSEEQKQQHEAVEFEEKLENMDNKLETIQKHIIDDTVKYVGSHEGTKNHENIQRLKDYVLSRLTTAYSLEKMRLVLNSLMHSDVNNDNIDNHIDEIQRKLLQSEADELDKKKRVATKKEKALFDNNGLPLELSTEKVSLGISGNSDDSYEEDRKKKLMPNPFDFTGSTNVQSLNHLNKTNHLNNELMIGNHNNIPNDDYSNYDEDELNIERTNTFCPLLDSAEKRCRKVEIMNGDIYGELLQPCGVHQICYLCGSKRSTCDYRYLFEADAICDHNIACQTVARSILNMLRRIPVPHLPPNECKATACLSQAMQDVGL